MQLLIPAEPVFNTISAGEVSRSSPSPEAVPVLRTWYLTRPVPLQLLVFPSFGCLKGVWVFKMFIKRVLKQGDGMFQQQTRRSVCWLINQCPYQPLLHHNGLGRARQEMKALYYPHPQPPAHSHSRTIPHALSGWRQH